MYIQIENKRGNNLEPKSEIYVTKSQFINYTPLIKFYKINANYIQLFLDKENRKIALHFSSINTSDCFKIGKNNNSKTLNISNLIKYNNLNIKQGKYEIKKTNFNDIEIYEFQF